MAKAKKLIENGADVKAADEQGRTALHWEVFGSSYTTKPKVLVAYEEIADRLIERGADINRDAGESDTLFLRLIPRLYGAMPLVQDLI